MEKDVRKHYTMQNMADISCVNKSSVYRFLKKKNIKPVTTEHNTQYYSSNTMQQVKKHFKTDNSNADKKVIMIYCLKHCSNRLLILKRNWLRKKYVRIRNSKKGTNKLLDIKNSLINVSNYYLTSKIIKTFLTPIKRFKKVLIQNRNLITKIVV